MGLLAIKFATVDSISGGRGDLVTEVTGWYNELFGTSSDANLIDAAMNATGYALGYLYKNPGPGVQHITGSITFGFDENSEIFVLDGGAPVSFNSLPAGFVITSLQYKARFFLIAAPAENPGPNICSFEFIPVVSTQSQDMGVTGVAEFTGEIVDTGTTLLAQTFIGYQFKISFDIQVTYVFVNHLEEPLDCLGIRNFPELILEGTYVTQSFQWTLHTPPSPGVNPGTTSIQVTSNAPSVPATLPLPSLEPLDFDHVDHYEIQFPDPDDPETIITYIVPGTSSSSTYEVIFVTPVFSGGETPPVITVVAVGDGTQFDGSIELGQLLTIYFTDGTGIYKLVPDKTNDTLYVQDSDPVQTVDVKIPDPFAKTGFLP